MRKWLRIFIIVFGSLLGLLVLLWLALALYIRQNKPFILQQISEQLNDRLHGGQLQIKDMEPALVQSFPDVSVSLKEVSVRDSLWSQHHHELVHVSRVYVKVNTFSLLRKQLNIKQISLQDGAVYLYTDSTGYSNTRLFNKDEKVESSGRGSSTKADITRLQMEHIRLTMDNQKKGKLFDFDIDQLKGSFFNNDSGWTANVKMDLQVKSFAFNTDRGSFLKDKRLETSLELNFNKRTNRLDIPQQSLHIDDGQILSTGAVFTFGEVHTFKVHIITEQIPLTLAASMLPPNLNAKLNEFHVEHPLDAEALIEGGLKAAGTPLVKVTWKTKDNFVATKAMELTECAFGGSYENEWIKGNGHGDDNSIISLYAFNAKLYGIPVTADTIHISNLEHPALTGYFKADFPLTELNDASGDEGVFTFTGGTAKANLYYRGGITMGDTIVPYLKGTVDLKDGAMAYTPRNLQFKNCNAHLEFNGQDLFLQHITVQSAKSSLAMEGSVRNIAPLFFTAPDKLELDWTVRSPMLDLNEFKSFLGKRGTRVVAKTSTSKAATRRKISRVAQQLDVMLNSCNVNLNVQVDKLIFDRFAAQQVKADLSLNQEAIRLQQIALSHAGGTIRLNGDVRQDGRNNRFKINTDIQNVHIDQLFYAFNDFGMQTLNAKNLKGIFSAKAAISGNVLDNGKVAPQSLYGTLNFELRQGALVHVPQLEEIGDIAFRKRNLGNITFENVKNTLTLQGNKVIVPPMQINSSAIYMDIEGVYGMPTGTDLYIDVPLRNPSKDEEVTDKEEKKKRRQKGIVLHLHAADDGTGKVKVKLGGKKKEKNSE